MKLEIRNGWHRRNTLVVTIYPGGYDDLHNHKVIGLPRRSVLEIDFGGTAGMPAVEVHSTHVAVLGWVGCKLLSTTIKCFGSK